MKNFRTSTLLAIACAFATTGCMTQIPPASVGIKFNANSGISEQLLKPQVVYRGITDRVIIYPTSIKNATYVKNSDEGERRADDSVMANTNEGGQLPVDVTVAWHVDPANVAKMFENFGTEDLDRIQRDFIRYYTIYSVGCVSGSKSIFEVTSKDRANLGGEVKTKLRPLLEAYGITVDDVYIGEVYPNQDLLAKVSDRLNKYNELTLAKNNLERARIDAQTILTNAQKQAKLNELLSQQGDGILALKKIDNRQKAVEKWDGEPPQIGDGTIPFTTIKLK